MHLERLGDSGPVVVLVHGSVAAGLMAWEAQRPLAERFRLVIPHRSGYPPNLPRERIDFEEQAHELAELLDERAHVVAHSYGAVVSMLAAALRPEAVRSLTVLEPPAFDVARGHPAVEEFLAHFERGVLGDPRGYLEFFLPLVGSAIPLPDPLPPALEAGARAAMAERPPHEAKIPLAELGRAPYPKLVVSGAHSAAFDAVCDVLQRELGATRAVIPGAGHSIPRVGAPLNDLLEAFLARTERRK